MKQKLRFLFALVLIFVAALFLSRVYFFLKYSATFSGAHLTSIALSFLRGVRFYLSTASIMSSPFLVALLL
ncbi:MAG TPA: hypothetical protein VIK48_06860, partial [Candidatus Manganitrophaceae bacterium]